MSSLMTLLLPVLLSIVAAQIDTNNDVPFGVGKHFPDHDFNTESIFCHNSWMRSAALNIRLRDHQWKSTNRLQSHVSIFFIVSRLMHWNVFYVSQKWQLFFNSTSADKTAEQNNKNAKDILFHSTLPILWLEYNLKFRLEEWTFHAGSAPNILKINF